jgi:hypothetical protein
MFLKLDLIYMALDEFLTILIKRLTDIFSSAAPVPAKLG